MDFSDVVIDQMKQKCRLKPSLKFVKVTASIVLSSFDRDIVTASRFDVVVDKGTLDSILIVGPKDVKLYINQSAISFDDVGAVKAAQSFKLSANDLSGKVLPLKAIGFQTVRSVTLFISSNQKGASSTFVKRIQLFGVPAEQTDMSKLEAVGCASCNKK